MILIINFFNFQKVKIFLSIYLVFFVFNNYSFANKFINYFYFVQIKKKIMRLYILNIQFIKKNDSLYTTLI